MLYVEGSTDLSILGAFARRLGHERALRALERPFVHYAGNQVRAVQSHFHGLREALPRLGGVALFDRLDTAPPDLAPIECLTWTRPRDRELRLHAGRAGGLRGGFGVGRGAGGRCSRRAEADRRVRAMRESIAEIESALKDVGQGLAVGRGRQGERRVPGPALPGVLREARVAEPDGEEELPRAGRLRARRRDRSRGRREARTPSRGVAEAASAGDGGLGRWTREPAARVLSCGPWRVFFWSPR